MTPSLRVHTTMAALFLSLVCVAHIASAAQVIISRTERNNVPVIGSGMAGASATANAAAIASSQSAASTAAHIHASNAAAHAASANAKVAEAAAASAAAHSSVSAVRLPPYIHHRNT